MLTIPTSLMWSWGKKTWKYRNSENILWNKKKYKRKGLILCNLSELYSSFKQKYPNLKIGISKFCYLSPKGCVLDNTDGTQCIYTQYIKKCDFCWFMEQALKKIANNWCATLYVWKKEENECWDFLWQMLNKR